MAFCKHCGQEFIKGGKFCGGCGKPIDGEYFEEGRKSFYDGEIHKCPNCGEVLGSFVTNCPNCGYEIRNVKKTGAAADLDEKLQSIDAKRGMIDDASIVERKISTIENYFIPNTKEDIFEFIVLAASHIDLKDKNASKDRLMQAWKKKFEQAYYKAKMSFGASEDFQKVERIYKEEIIKPKRKKIEKIVALVLAWLLAMGGSIAAIVLTEKKEREREELLNKTTIKLNISDEEIVGDNYEDVVLYLKSVGFTNIETKEIRDGETDEGKINYGVESVSFDGDKDFSKGDRFAFATKIIVAYRIITTIEINFSAEDVIGKNYEEVLTMFEALGFTNIETKELKDLTTGWIEEENTVESVSINGNTEFDSWDRFNPNDKIVINYHSFRW